METAARLVRVARRGSRLTQRQLAATTHRAQSEIARLEAGGHAVQLQLVDRLVRGADHRLAVLPTTRTPVAEHADAIAQLLERHDERRAFRAVIQLADDLAAESGAERVALTVARPPSTGDERYDALIAGVTEVRLAQDRLPLPKWLVADAHTLAELWFVDPSSEGNAAVVRATPRPLRRRGVILDRAELESV